LLKESIPGQYSQAARRRASPDAGEDARRADRDVIIIGAGLLAWRLARVISLGRTELT
jgi:hypothetical protein